MTPMTPDDPLIDDTASHPREDDSVPAIDVPPSPGRGRSRTAGILLLLLIVAAVIGFFVVRRQIARQMNANLPQIDGTLSVFGLAAPVTIVRDAHGVPHIHAHSMNDLVFAQGYVTAQDRLWQMDMLRRYAAGRLAEVFGRSRLQQDRLQRTLQIRAAADRAYAVLPDDQKHWLEVYARGVNASIADQHDHLPVEFRLLGYTPAAWSPRDSILVGLTMFQQLTHGFPNKLGREALAAKLSPEMIADLYPTGSWRDHPPTEPTLDLTAPQTDIPDIPLDESQTRLNHPPSASPFSPADLADLRATLALSSNSCDTCRAGSNGWAVSGSRTASGKPLLSNDMHFRPSLPGIWYEADLQADVPAPLTPFHAVGVTLPGTPFIIVGHNDHVAWGFTNLGADVQDLFIEHTRGTPSGAEYQEPGGAWRPVRYQSEVIHVRGGADVTLDVPLTHHGNIDTPIISSLYPNERRTLSLAWTIYDPANVSSPFFAVNLATDWNSILSAFSTWGGPAMNMMYADDQGHIGYHALGRIPVRGDAANPTQLAAVPVDTAAPDEATHEWVGYIPFDQLPQAYDPPGGVLATANSRVTLDSYRFPITLDWMSPYRTERIYKVLEASPQRGSDAHEPGTVPMAVPTAEASAGGTLAPVHPLTPADMLALQNDVFSELDQVIAQRLAYSIDHAGGPLKNDKRLHQAADVLRRWNGNVDANAAAPAIVGAARNAFWPMLLIPHLAPRFASQIVQGADLSMMKVLQPEDAADLNLWQAYSWGERSAVEEQMLMHTPARWLPSGFATWDDFLAAVVQRGLNDAHAPADLTTWQESKVYPVDIEHPIFGSSRLVPRLFSVPIGTGPQPHSGDGTTVRQITADLAPSERFTADLGNLDNSTLNIVLGQSGNPASPWFMDQFQDWLRGTTYSLPFTPSAVQAAATHTLVLQPR
jgi:penicillin amidase